ncbi:glycine cleavage system H protein-like [Xenia sp. Carnegie-2017]|uniref:glycine cleavage system H protein-like n=1 Tax=Xenia sp. Carnegie-2017 TaxID=2897299 RepID=UPI001F035B63|nr:glycine cleavage system H protein-like [Xenia sp. Carnegie-2017]
MAAVRLGKSVLRLSSFRVMCVNLDYSIIQAKRIHTAYPLATERKYTKDHEWISMSDDVGTVGITNYAQNLLGDVVYIDLPDIGTKFDQNEIFGVVESVKAASDLYAPVSGEITHVNEALPDTPDLINREPYGEGWIAKMKLSDKSQLDELMDQASYDAYTEENDE